MAHDHHPRHLQSTEPSWIHPSNASTKKVIEWRDVSLDFAGRQVISGVTTWIHQGELTCICGSNGAGKTQILRLALGMIDPRVGEVKLLGENPLRTRHRVGYVPQMKSFNRNYPATVEDVLVAAVRGTWPLWVKRSERDLAAMSLQSVGGLPLLDKDIGVLSGGEMQRVFMARALISKPEVLVLDEPMAAVDAKGRVSLLDLLRKLRSDTSMTIALITHSEAIVSELADRVIFLEKGHLVGWGTPAQVLSIDALRQVAFFGHDHEAAIDGGEG